MRSAKTKAHLSNHPPADHEVESSNSTASLFLGGRRKSWMLDPSSSATTTATTSIPPPHSIPRPPLRSRPRPPSLVAPAPSDKPHFSADAPASFQGMRSPTSRAPPASISVSAPCQKRPSTARASAGPLRPIIAAPSQNARLDSQATVTTASALESALMSPVTPGESRLEHHPDAVLSPPPTDPCVSTTTKATTPAIPAPTTTATARSHTHAFPASQAFSLPSPDPSNPSHPSPASAVDRTSEEQSSPATRSVQMHPQQLQNPSLAALPASVHVGGMNAGNSTSNHLLDAAPAPRQQTTQPTQGMAHTTLHHLPSPTSEAPNGTGPGASEMTIDNLFWENSHKRLDALLGQHTQASGLSESVELPRLRLLRDACNSRDLLYLALHQVYCFSTFAPSEFVSLPGFSMQSIRGLKVLEQLLVENQRLSGGFLSWCVNFPNVPHVMMGSPQYRAALEQVPQCLSLFHERWLSYDTHVRARGYPPLIDELVVRFGVTSSVMLSIIFLAMCRRVYGSRHEIQLKGLFLQNKQNYDRRFADTRSTPPERMQQENERLIQAYLSLNPLHLNSPGVVPVGSALSSPQVNSPQLATAASHSSSPFPATEQSQTQRQQQPLHVASPVTMSAHGSQGQITRPVTAQAGIQHHPNMNPRVSAPGPNRIRPFPPNITDQPSSRGMVTAPHPSPGFQVDVPRAQNYNQQLMLLQQMCGYPLPSPTTVNPPPTPARMSASPHQVVPPRPVQPQARATTNVQNATQARADGGVNRQSRTPGSAAPRGAAARPLQNRLAVPQNTLLPQPGWIPANTLRPNPLRVSLHQAHLRDPMLKMIRFLPSGEEETELFQYLQSFTVPPSPLGLVECAFRMQFSLSSSDCQRLPSTTSRGAGERPLRVLTEGVRTHRLRCIKVPRLTTKLPGHAWNVAESVWPSVLYIFVNGLELYVRRKVHNGKDIPLDITDYLREGVNTISIHLIRNAAESKNVFYMVGVEMMDIAGYDHVKNLAQSLPASESREQIKQRLSSRAEDEELSIVNDDLTVNLVDPFMARTFNIPARGTTCAHQECFDLDTFLMTRVSKSGKGPMVEKWKCPICGEDARPQNLIIDGFLVDVHAELKRTNQLDNARAIQIKADGTWELKTDKDAQAAEEPREPKTKGVSAKRKLGDDSSLSASPVSRRLKTEGATTPSASVGRGSQPSSVIELD